jgi:hypothetical protein
MLEIILPAVGDLAGRESSLRRFHGDLLPSTTEPGREDGRENADDEQGDEIDQRLCV